MKYLYIIIIAVFYGCSGNDVEKSTVNQGNPVEIKIDVSEAKPMHMSEFFSNISYFPLTAPGDSPIGRINKIMPQGDKIALYDQAKKSVWIYTENGDYLNEVRIPQGRGPGELEHISDVYFDEEFRIQAMGAFKFVTLDLQGNLLNETQLNLFATYLIYNTVDSTYFAFADGNPNLRLPEHHQGYNLYEFDENGKIENRYIPIEKNKQGIAFGIPNYFPTYKSQKYFFKHLHDTVYSIGTNGVEPAYTFDFGSQALPDEIFEKRSEYGSEIWQWTDFFDNEVRPYDYITHKNNFEITDRFIHTRVGSSQSKHMILYDRDSKVTHVGEEKFVNDIDFGPSPFIYQSSDEHLFSYVNANDFLRLMNDIYENDREKYLSTSMDRLRSIANSMTDARNPILMRLNFK